MRHMLECPNPSCPYVFDPSQVPVGVVLSCPRCGMQFTLGPPAPAASTAAPPGYAPAPGYASAPGYPSNSPAAPGYGTTAPPSPRSQPINPELEAVGQRAIRERDPDAPLPGRRTSKLQVFILAGIAAVLMAGTGLAIIFKLMWHSDPIPTDTVKQLKELNVGIDSPLSSWSRDEDIRAKLGPPYLFVYKREQPEAYMAFGARDFETTSPRPSEMFEGRMVPINRLFNPTTFQPEPPSETSWMGESITKDNGNRFRIQSSDGLNWQGEVYSVTHKGIGYWWVSWCGENDFDGLRDEFAKFRSRFKLLTLRENWTETRSNIVPYKGATVNYTILDADDIWKETDIKEFKAEDPDLDKRLRINATPRRDRKALPNQAELRVYLVDDAGDPLEVARQYVEAKRTREVTSANPKATPTFEVLTDAPEGDPVLNQVDATAPYVRFRSKVENFSNSNQLIVVSAIRVGNKVVVVHCWCDLPKRSVFETKFVQIASSLREG